MSFLIPTLADAIALVQQKANDTPTCHLENDDLTEFVDGIRTVFKLGKRNIVVGNNTCQYIKDGGALTQLDPTDPVFGIFTLSPAPAVSLELFYYYTNFTYVDVGGVASDMHSFVDQALAEMEYTEANFSPDGIQPATIPQPHFLAMGFFAASYAIKILMDRFAENFNATLEGTALEESEIYKAYRASYQDNIKEGQRLREEYWSNQTRSKRPYTNSTRARYRDRMEPRQ